MVMEWVERKMTMMDLTKPNLDYFDWEMYFIIVLSYAFGFMGGWAHYWLLPITLIFLAYPFYKYNKFKKDGNSKNNR